MSKVKASMTSSKLTVEDLQNAMRFSTFWRLESARHLRWGLCYNLLWPSDVIWRHMRHIWVNFVAGAWWRQAITWLQCMKWPVAHSPNSTWFWLELVGNCCERLKIIMECTNIQFCEQLRHGWQFHPLWLPELKTSMVYDCSCFFPLQKFGSDSVVSIKLGLEPNFLTPVCVEHKHCYRYAVQNI